MHIILFTMAITTYLTLLMIGGQYLSPLGTWYWKNFKLHTLSTQFSLKEEKGYNHQMFLWEHYNHDKNCIMKYKCAWQSYHGLIVSPSTCVIKWHEKFKEEKEWTCRFITMLHRTGRSKENCSMCISMLSQYPMSFRWSKIFSIQQLISHIE